MTNPDTPTAQPSERDRAMTAEERALIEPLLRWTPCPHCDGAAKHWTGGQFCMVCGQSGEITASAAILVRQIMMFMPDRAEIEAAARADERASVIAELVQRSGVSGDGVALDIMQAIANSQDYRPIINEALAAAVAKERVRIDALNADVAHALEVLSKLWAYRPKNLAQMEDGPRDAEAQAWFGVLGFLQMNDCRVAIESGEIENG